MISTATPELSKPYRVVTNTGTFVRGYDTNDEAEDSAKQRTDKAQEMGLKVAYFARVIGAAAVPAEAAKKLYI